MVAGRAVVMVTAVVARAVVVMAADSVAAKSADAAADERSGKRVAVEGGGEPGTGHGTDSRGGEDAMFARPAGSEGESEEADKAEREKATHEGPPFRSFEPPARREGFFRPAREGGSGAMGCGTYPLSFF